MERNTRDDGAGEVPRGLSVARQQQSDVNPQTRHAPEAAKSTRPQVRHLILLIFRTRVSRGRWQGTTPAVRGTCFFPKRVI